MLVCVFAHFSIKPLRSVWGNKSNCCKQIKPHIRSSAVLRRAAPPSQPNHRCCVQLKPLCCLLGPSAQIRSVFQQHADVTLAALACLHLYLLLASELLPLQPLAKRCSWRVLEDLQIIDDDLTENEAKRLFTVYVQHTVTCCKTLSS